MNIPFEPAALDVGYGWTKAKTSIAEIIRPSIVGPAIDIGYQTNLVAAADGLTVELDGRFYFVGERARRQSPDPLTPQNRARSLEIVKLLGLTTLHQARAANISRLVTGLPVSWYADDKDALEAALTGEHSLVVNGEAVQINIATVTIMPQPMGTIFNSMISNGIFNDPRHLAKHRVAVLDIGMHTTDAALVDALEYIELSSSSIETAGGAFFKSLQRSIAERYHLSLSIVNTEAAYHNGYVILWGKEVKLPDAMLNDAIKDVADIIVAFVQDLWQGDDDPKSFRIIFITGGNAPMFYVAIRAALPSAVLVKEPHLANVRGFYEFALLKEKGRARKR